jgi:hypothetical protein
MERRARLSVRLEIEKATTQTDSGQKMVRPWTAFHHTIPASRDNVWVAGDEGTVLRYSR